MNTIKKIAINLGIALTSLILANQAAFAGVAGYAQFVNGSVQIVSAAGETRTLQKGVAVNEGDTVISAKGASAQIKMQDGGFVAMRPDTRLKFDSFIFNGKEDGSERSYFSLFKGGFRAVTGLIGRVHKTNYRITTSVATIGIRGTDHETFVVGSDSSLANAVPTGTYNKVNVGETFMATDKGTIFVLPNQMGFAGAADQMPELRPLNTDIFTVADKPTKEAKSDKEEGKEDVKEVRETATVDNTAEQGAAPAAEVASSTGEGKETHILQPITTTDGIDLTGEETSGGGGTPSGGPFAAYTPSNILIETSVPFFSKGWGSPMAAPADIIYTPTGSSNLSSFIDREIVGGGSISYSETGGVTPVTGVATSATTGIQFGRWTSVTALEYTLTATLGGANWGGVPTTWMYGPEGYLDAGITAPAGQMYGTFTYALDGNTAPYDKRYGRSGTLNSASIGVDFTTSLVSADLALTVGGQAWSASASNLSLSGPQFFAGSSPGGTNNNLTVSMGVGAPTLCPTCFGSLNGAFTGQNYAGAILSYNLGDSSANAGGEVSGQAALARTGPTITNGTAAPTGMYMVADYGGSIQTADTLSTDVSGVLTAYSSGSAAAPGSGYMSTTVTCTTCTSTPATNATNAVAPTGIYLGTWDAGSYTQAWGFGIGSASPHWITGPEAGPLFLANALVGTKTFSFDGGMVTNFMGTPGTVLGTTALTVDFTRQVVDINIDLSVPDMQTTPVSHTWNAQTLAGNEAIINGGRGIGGAAFQASSYNITGPGFLTVTVDGSTPGFGNVSGQLSGIGLNGAILSYDLSALLPSFSFEQVNGVAALASTTSNIATPHRQVMMSLTDPNAAAIPAVPVLGYYANAPARMVTDGAGNLTRFDMNTINNGGNNDPSMTLASNTSVLADAGNNAATGISWGRWEGGSVNATDRNTAVTTPHTLAGSLHWIAGPTETAAVTLPVSGTYTYTNAGGTAPTDNLGTAGTLNNATLSADFTAQTVNVGVNVTVAGSTLDAAAANVPIIQKTAFYADSMIPVGTAGHLTVTCATGCGTSAQGVIVGGFSGAGATGAMMAYGLQNVSTASNQVISGVTAFHR
ncbi:MAG: FecR family protein [Gallionella sp.]|nr:FecR family protein [Gallionella sp.]